MNNIQSGRHYELIALDYLITKGFCFTLYRSKVFEMYATSRKNNTKKNRKNYKNNKYFFEAKTNIMCFLHRCFKYLQG